MLRVTGATMIHVSTGTASLRVTISSELVAIAGVFRELLGKEQLVVAHAVEITGVEQRHAGVERVRELGGFRRMFRLRARG